MSDFCSSCGQVIREAHKEFLTQGKLAMLKMAATHVMATMRNDVSLRTFDNSPNLYNNFQKLRYHGLVYYVEKRGERVRGHWLITRNGWAFLRGEINLPKYVIVQHNHISSRSDQLIGVREVYRGSDVIQTTFEYFDNEGNPVGWRPVQRSSTKQMSLV